MKLYITAVIILLSGKLCAQQPVYASAADSLRLNDNMQAALREYGSLFAKSPHDSKNYYGYGCALAADASYGEAYKYLNLAAEADPSLQPLTDPALMNLRMNAGWSAYETTLIKKVTTKYGNIPQLAIARQLWEMKALDALYLHEKELLEKTMGKDAMIINLIMRSRSEIFIKNQKQLAGIIDAGGWPVISAVGKEAAEAAAVVLMHSLPSVQKKYLPLLKEACTRKEADYKYYAVICDQVLLESGQKKQLYGTQVVLNFVTGKYHVLPIDDEVNVDKRRREIGLQPLADYLQQWKISYSLPVK